MVFNFIKTILYKLCIFWGFNNKYLDISSNFDVLSISADSLKHGTLLNDLSEFLHDMDKNNPVIVRVTIKRIGLFVPFYLFGKGSFEFGLSNYAGGWLYMPYDITTIFDLKDLEKEEENVYFDSSSNTRIILKGWDCFIETVYYDILVSTYYLLNNKSLPDENSESFVSDMVDFFSNLDDGLKLEIVIEKANQL